MAVSIVDPGWFSCAMSYPDGFGGHFYLLADFLPYRQKNLCRKKIFELVIRGDFGAEFILNAMHIADVLTRRLFFCTVFYKLFV